MPLMTGIQLRDKLQRMGPERLKTVPFLFLTTSFPQDDSIKEYFHSVQGFFRKGDTYESLQ